MKHNKALHWTPTAPVSFSVSHEKTIDCNTSCVPCHSNARLPELDKAHVDISAHEFNSEAC